MWAGSYSPWAGGCPRAVMDNSQVDAVVKAILETAATGKIGDGKIFLSKVDEAIRIRNQERGVAAL